MSHISRVEVGLKDIVVHVHLREDDVGDRLEAHEQYRHTRAMESTAPTATPVRKRMIQSIGESANSESASQEEDALIVFSSIET